MTTELLEQLRAQLEEQRRSALAELEEYGADPRSHQIAHIDVDGNFADSAAATAERSEILAFIESTRERLAQAETALARMDEGTYGTCVDCGQPIPEARLEARPLSIRCVECAAARS
jgi:DnaK suppressor protein